MREKGKRKGVPSGRGNPKVGFPRERSRDGADQFMAFERPQERQKSPIRVRPPIYLEARNPPVAD